MGSDSGNCAIVEAYPLRPAHVIPGPSQDKRIDSRTGQARAARPLLPCEFFRGFSEIRTLIWASTAVSTASEHADIFPELLHGCIHHIGKLTTVIGIIELVSLAIMLVFQ